MQFVNKQRPTARTINKSTKRCCYLCFSEVFESKRDHTQKEGPPNIRSVFSVVFCVSLFRVLINSTANYTFLSRHLCILYRLSCALSVLLKICQLHAFQAKFSTLRNSAAVDAPSHLCVFSSVRFRKTKDTRVLIDFTIQNK